MFSIRRIYDDSTAPNLQAVEQVQAILREQFSGVPEDEITALPAKLLDPLKYRFRSILFLAEGSRGQISGFALLMHAPDLHFAYLDFISAAAGSTGGGIGGALYERVREEAQALKVVGLFFECLPDDPALSRDAAIRRRNVARLKFYERYGARPIAHTAYETPVTPGGDNPPYLVLDTLDRNRPLRRKEARKIVRAILERKYGELCPVEYVDMVVDSFRDDPVNPRPYRYVPPPGEHDPAQSEQGATQAHEKILLVVNEKHAIHHVRERGYVESPVRIDAVLKEITPTGMFERAHAKRFPKRHIEAVHDPEFVRYLQRACALVPAGKSVYPYIFPIRNVARPPKELPLRAGYYCIDTFTPLNASAHEAALHAVDCALTGAEAVAEGRALAYALVRPPGHHAERRSFGGFCYFNSAAIAAELLSTRGRVALIDVDYHHGNGTQDIFYGRSDVLTLSIHGHPRFTYPYFSGYSDERGAGEGQGFNRNFPLPENIGANVYQRTLERAIRRIRAYRPKFLVISLGLDTAKGDPTGSFTLGAPDFRENGVMLGALKLPTLVVQEGGYRTRSLGVNARNFFQGLWDAHQGQAVPARKSPAVAARAARPKQAAAGGATTNLAARAAASAPRE